MEARTKLQRPTQTHRYAVTTALYRFLLLTGCIRVRVQVKLAYEGVGSKLSSSLGDLEGNDSPWAQLIKDKIHAEYAFFQEEVLLVDTTDFLGKVRHGEAWYLEKSGGYLLTHCELFVYNFAGFNSLLMSSAVIILRIYREMPASR